MNYVEPIRNLKSIKALKAYLKDNKRPRDYLLFTLGINIALRIGDLLKLKVGAVAERDGDGWRMRDELRTIEGKTSKRRIMQLNDSAREAVQFWLDAHDDATESDYLFASQKHMDRPITSGQAEAGQGVGGGCRTGRQHRDALAAKDVRVLGVEERDAD